MKVLVSLNFPKIAVDMLRAEGLEVTAWQDDLPMDKARLMAATRKHDILLSSSIYELDAAFLEHNKHLKLISQFERGRDRRENDLLKKIKSAEDCKDHALVLELLRKRQMQVNQSQ